MPSPIDATLCLLAEACIRTPLISVRAAYENTPGSSLISNQPSELAGFPSLFDSIKCCVVKETVDVPVRVAEPGNRTGVAMEEL
jgi:hypothetical protein